MSVMMGGVTPAFAASGTNSDSADVYKNKTEYGECQGKW